jgi:dipeptidyl aminopeptidase/acylaminoacyl peptidase
MDKRSLVPLGAALIDAGYRVVLIDLRGHGDSSGEYLTYGVREAEDVSAVVASLGPGFALEPLGVYGYSYGGAVALAFAAREPAVRAVTAVSTFSSLRAVMGDYERKYLPGPLRMIPDSWFQGAVDRAAARAEFDPDLDSPLRFAERSSAPLLLLHGASDTQVPPQHSRALAAAARGRARLVVVPGATHESLLLEQSGSVTGQVIAWFDRHLVAAGEGGPPGPAPPGGCRR